MWITIGIGLMLGGCWMFVFSGMLKDEMMQYLMVFAGICVLGIGLVVLTTSMARAAERHTVNNIGGYSCSHVREFVGHYGRIRALILARAYGITASQLRQARSCL
jgi:hypothetical protein